MLDQRDISNTIAAMSPLDIRIELFKKRNFDFITKGVRDGVPFEHEKQKEALQILTSNKYKEFMFGGAANGAKAQPLYSKVYTPFGFKMMGDIKIGDAIKHPNGGNTNVIAIHPQGKKKIYEVTFYDGVKTRCCEDHLWQVWYSGLLSKQEIRNGRGRVRTTRMLIEELDRGKKPLIPLTEPVEFTLPKGRGNSLWDKIHPYVLGALIGDGGLTKQLGFSSEDKEILDRISELLPNGYKLNNLTGKYAYSITQNKKNDKGFGVNELYDLIRELKLDCKSEFKFLPKELMHSPLWVRWELAKGLMDTDGSASKSHCTFSSSSEKLADDFREILLSLGFRVTKKREETTHLDSFKLNIQGRNKEELFYLKRKKERVKPFNNHNIVGRRIVSIDEIGYEDAQCITVDALDGLYITDDYIVTHNSWTGCTWIGFMCLAYPGTKWFIARTELKDLKESVLDTFGKVASAYEFGDYKFNGVDHFIKFPNGSKIIFKEISYKPSDPMYESLGSTEYTGGWIEESGEVDERGAQVISKRAGRHLNDKYGIKKIIFYTCNPKKNWNKTEFYDKWKNGTLEPHKMFLPSLVIDNPFREEGTLEDLESYRDTDTVLYERLFKGNWDYEENPNALCEYDMIEQVFGNDHIEEGQCYLTADIARFGADKARIIVWKGWIAVEHLSFDISKTTEISLAINILRRKYKIPKNKCIGDADGVGGGVIDQTGILGFTNNATAIKMKGDLQNYRNLQVQCLYALADKVNEGGIWINFDPNSTEIEEIKQELDQIQSSISDYGKLDVKRKSEIKKDIGRSPDWRDTLLMRSYFDLKPDQKIIHTTEQTLAELGVSW